MRHLAVLALLSVSLFAQPSGVLTDPDAYAVYNAVIPSDSFVRSAQPSELLIQDTTEVAKPMSKSCLPSGPELTGPWLETLNDFRAQHVTAKFLDRQFSIPMAYRFESRDTIQSFFTNTAGPIGWEAFYAAYPKSRGFLRLSAVGFDQAHEHAFVYMADACGGLCGEGAFHFLLRTADAWKEVRLNVDTCWWVS